MENRANDKSVAIEAAKVIAHRNYGGLYGRNIPAVRPRDVSTRKNGKLTIEYEKGLFANVTLAKDCK